MKLFITTLFSIIGFTLLANGDPNKNTIVLKGVVQEYTHGESLTGVRVSLLGSDDVVFTDKDGFFEIETTVSSEMKIVFTLVSFESRIIDIPPSEGDILKIMLVEK